MHKHFSQTDGGKGKSEEEEGREQVQDENLKPANSPHSPALRTIKIHGLLSPAAWRAPAWGRRQTRTTPCCVSHLEPPANAAPMLLTPLPKPSSCSFSPSPHHFSIPLPALAAPDYTGHLSNVRSYFFPPSILFSQHVEAGNFLRLQIPPTHSMPSAKSKPLPNASCGCFSPSTNFDCSGDDTRKLVRCSVRMN